MTTIQIYKTEAEVAIARPSVTIAIAGTPGPAGPPGVALSYTHTQASASDTWVINHNLGVMPHVTLYSVGSVEIDGAVAHPTVNQAVATFSTPVAGFARCS